MYVLRVFIITDCTNKKEHETTPIRLNTPEGLLVCQLYALDFIMWDTSITRLKSMIKETANKICISEGARLQREIETCFGQNAKTWTVEKI